MSGKVASLQITHEDFKESSGQGHKGTMDRLQSFEKADEESQENKGGSAKAKTFTSFDNVGEVRNIEVL